MDTNGPHPDLRVLLIEDAPATAAILQLFMDEMGLPDAEWVDSLAAAEALIPRIRAGDFDVILSDLLLSDSNATDFLKRMAGEADCSILICSGEADLSTECREHRLKVLPKPVSFETLTTELSRIRPASRAATFQQLPARGATLSR